MEDITKLTDTIAEKINTKIETATKNFVTNEELTKQISEVTPQIETLQKSINETTEAVKKQGEIINSLNVKASEIPVNSIYNELKTAAETLKNNLAKGIRTPYSFLVKTVATMSRANSVTGQIPQADRLAGVNNVVRQLFALRNQSNVSTTNSNLVEWVEQTGIEGGAGMTAEGTAKTQLDWHLQVASAKVEKITSYVKIVEELLSDVEGMQAEINGNLLYQIGLKEEQMLLSGNGSTPNIKGVTAYAQTVDLTALQNTVENANYIDAIGAAIAQIYTNGKGMFIPNVIYLNPVDAYLLKSQKDTDGEYVMPSYMMPDGLTISGIKVIESVTITAGYFLVGDFTKFNIKDREATRIEIGWDQDDFTKNIVTIRAEKRLASFVKLNDVEAFIYDSFANVIAFINKAS